MINEGIYVVITGDRTDELLQARLFSDWMVVTKNETKMVVCVTDAPTISRIKAMGYSEVIGLLGLD